jgi:hypothetical protein
MMRLALALVCAFACSKRESPRQPPDVRVDRRVEAISILHRLVGEREYTTAPSTKYIAALDAHFAGHADHAAIAATRELRRQGITYDAPMQLAVHLDDRFRLRARPDDPRFASIDLDGYAATVRDFVATTGFDAFFAGRRTEHEAMLAPLEAAIAKEDARSWFDAFFAKRPDARFITVACAVCGRWNFAPRAPADEIYQVVGLWKLDFDDRPIVDDEIVELVVHELAHAFINPLFAGHREALAPHAERLFAPVADVMRQRSYGDPAIFLNELGVRAIVTLYLHDRRGPDAASRAMEREVQGSFAHVPGLVELIRAGYLADRARYRSFDAFMPDVIGWLAAQP